MTDRLAALRRAQDRDLARRDDLAVARERLQKRRPPRGPWVAAALVAAAVAIGGVGWLAREMPATLAYTSTHDLPIGTWLVVPGGSEERLAFDDGSVVRVTEGSRVRVARILDHGADVALDPGRAQVSVVHANDTAWRLLLGPYVVRVTGTRFEASWREHVLTIVMDEGTVIVEGPGLDAPHAVVTGQTFAITEPGWEPVAAVVVAPEAAAMPPIAPRARTATPRAITPPEPAVPSYRAAAEVGDYARALESPEATAIDPAHDDVSAADLLLLGDAARYTHHAPRARAFYEALRTRFSESDEARTATFGLGLVAFEAGDAEQAATWMRVYLVEAPDGPLAREARGRLIEALVMGHDDAGARAAAADYLARDPHGPHAPLAHHVADSP